MNGRRREGAKTREGDGFYMEDLHPIASEYEEIPSFRFLPESLRWISFHSSASSRGSSWSASRSKNEEKISHPLNIKIFSLQELQKATRNFHPKRLLATGGFAHFYKGKIAARSFPALFPLPRFSMDVVVKKFLPTSATHRAYDTELHHLSKIHHPNIVKLAGSCAENDNRLLVYELMTNGDLGYNLAMKQAHRLSWKIRIKIAVQIAGILAYLHSSKCRITHQLVSLDSILLDGEFNAKLTAFGLAKTIPDDASKLFTEYDVSCFGDVLLVLLSGRTQRFLVHDWEDWNDKGKIREFMDKKLDGQYSEEDAYTLGSLALRCTGIDSMPRPDMHEVLAILEKIQTKYR